MNHKYQLFNIKLQNIILLNTFVLITFGISYTFCETSTISPIYQIIDPDYQNDDGNPLLTRRNEPNETDNASTIGNLFKQASHEIVALSPLAWAMILVPVLTICIFICLICYTCCRRVKHKIPCRYDSNNLINVKVKQPPPMVAPTNIPQTTVGQQAPIPLTGLANQPYGYGLRSQQKSNNHLQVPLRQANH